MRFVIFLGLSLFFFGCAGTAYESRPEQIPPFKIADISNGLPEYGLWRQNIALFDMNGDGLMDIVAPPPRKADAEKKRPFIFVQSKDGWIEGEYRFPHLEDYDYGAVVVGDINRDGQPDIVLACHSSRIIVLINDGAGGFAEADFPLKQDFKTRAVELSDINNDGYPDIIAVSEFPPSPQGTQGSRPSQVQGILVGINKQGNGWDLNIIKAGDQFFGDSLSMGDINGDGIKDVIIAPLTTIKANKKVAWLGDGKGGFQHHDADFLGEMSAFNAGSGDLDGDGRDEMVLKLAGAGKGAEIKISVFKFSPEGLTDITYDLKPKAEPAVFDLAEIDGDGRDELLILSREAIHLYKFSGNAWAQIVSHPLPSADTKVVYDVKIGRQGDGSWIIAYNLGSETGEKTGIKAFSLKKN